MSERIVDGWEVEGYFGLVCWSEVGSWKFGEGMGFRGILGGRGGARLSN